MSTIIVSYDGTANDDDALALGKLLARTGATPRAGLRPPLTRVRSGARGDRPARCGAQAGAGRRLARGPGSSPAHRHQRLDRGGPWPAGRERGRLADRVRLGLPDATGAGRARDLGPAPARGRADRGRGGAGRASDARGASIESIALASSDGESAAQETAAALAAKLGARVVEPGAAEIDLIVAASQNGAPEGRVALGGATRGHLDAARSAVIVLPRGKPALI